MTGNNGETREKVLLVTESPAEYKEVTDGLERRGIDYEIVGTGNKGRERIASGEFSAVFLPSLFVGVNGSCAPRQYFGRYFNVPSAEMEIDDDERVAMNEGLSIIAAARKRGQITRVVYADDFAYCLDEPDGVESVLLNDSEKILKTLLGIK